MGPVTSEYQNHLEDEWIDTLKQRYSVNIKDGALEQLFTGNH